MPATRPRPKITVRDAVNVLSHIVAPESRRRILESLLTPDGFAEPLGRLRAAMRSHAFSAGGEATQSLSRVVQSLDQRTKAEGFHVLESWDYVAHAFADQTVPVLMLDRFAAREARPSGIDSAVEILLDQYLLSVLGLVVVRAWDDSDPDGVFDDVTRLLGMLGGGSKRFVDDASTVLLLAVSHYHPQEAAYDVLVDRIAALGEKNRLSFALACAPVLSGHFRWGLRFMYQRDFGRLRDDNVVDYPWLLLSTKTLLEAYCRQQDGSPGRASIVEGLLSALSADPRAFTGAAPRCLQSRRVDHELVRETLCQRRDQLLRDFEAVRPSPKSYSPLGFEVNFLCNALVAMVATSVADGAPHPSLDALLAPQRARDVAAEDLERYARSLMSYASGGASPGAAALILYDPYDAQHAYNMTMQVLAEANGSSPAL